MNSASRRIDEVRTPVLVWVAACAIGEAGGLEASSAVTAGVEQGMLGGDAALWMVLGGGLEGLVLGLCQWVALNRIGMAPRFSSFVGVTAAGAVGAFLLLHLARAAWGQGEGMVFVNMGLGAVAGALVGAAQAIPLAKQGVRPLSWILGCAAGWAAALALAGLLLPYLAGFGSVGMAALAGAGVGLVGGVLLGLFTARAIAERRANV